MKPHASAGFQSTPPARGATVYGNTPIATNEFQSTPPARGATCNVGRKRVPRTVSIHAPRAGGDGFMITTDNTGLVSIHAPRAGGDALGDARCRNVGSFNPRPPRGGRLLGGAGLGAPAPFQSTPPARGATGHLPDEWYSLYVSIHAPRAGGDVYPVLMPCTPLRFNPRPPRGGRLQQG